MGYLWLSRKGHEPSAPWLQVDEWSRSVSVPSVFAVGDVTRRISLTPVARMEGVEIAYFLFGHAPHSMH